MPMQLLHAHAAVAQPLLLTAAHLQRGDAADLAVSVVGERATAACCVAALRTHDVIRMG